MGSASTLVSHRHSVVIVGASLAGGRAAEALRSLGFDGRIVLIGAEPDPPYERPPLSKQVLLGTMGRDGPALRPLAGWSELEVELLLGEKAVGIDSTARAVVLESGRQVPAGSILLCTGSRNRTLTVPGADPDAVLSLRSLPESSTLRDRLQRCAHLVVIGGGLIGSEVGAVARQRGCRVTIVEMEDLPLGRVLGRDMAQTMLTLHRSNGVQVMTGVRPESITALGGGRSAVQLSSGATLEADVVLSGIGAVPETGLAVAAGAQVDDGVVVDEYCRTSLEGVWAAGDVTNHPSLRFGVRLRLESWDHAQRQAAAAASSILGRSDPYDEVPWFWSDQHDVNLQVGGVPRLADQTVVRGDREGLSFVEFGLRGGVLVSVSGVNRPRDVRRALQLIATGVAPSPGVLADDSYDLRALRVPAPL